VELAVFLGAPLGLAVQNRQVVVGDSQVPVQGVDFALPQEAVPPLQHQVAIRVSIPAWDKQRGNSVVINTGKGEVESLLNEKCFLI